MTTPQVLADELERECRTQGYVLIAADECSTVVAALRLSARNGEPAAWQYRTRADSTSLWSSWHNGRAPRTGWQTEQRPLYTVLTPADGAREAITFEFTEQELAVVQELSEYHQLSKLQTMRQALRLYQLHDRRIKDGETVTWSGDAKRAQEFAALARPVGIEGLEALEACTLVQEKLIDNKFYWCVVRTIHHEEILQNFGQGIEAKQKALAALARHPR